MSSDEQVIETPVSWQTGKSVTECSDYMFTHQVACDVHFHLRHPEHDAEEISAHKFVLISRSPVFYAMLCGDLASDNVDIVDIEPNVFKTMLRFLYTDNVKLTAHSVMHVLYTAKKYNISTLEDKCRSFLAANINSDTACVIYDQSRLFDEDDLQRDALSYIERNSENAFINENFSDLSKDSLYTIVKSDALMISELLLVRCVFAWAVNECKKQQLSNNRENRRGVLGDIVYNIRFPLLSCYDILDFSGDQGLLTNEEAIEVLTYKKANAPNDTFTTEKRSGTDPREFQIFDDHKKLTTIYSFPKSYTCTMNTTRGLEISALLLAKFTHNSVSAAEFYIDVEIANDTDIVHKEVKKLPSDNRLFTFSNPVRVNPGVFTITAKCICSSFDSRSHSACVQKFNLKTNPIVSHGVSLTISGDGVIGALYLQSI